MHVDRHIYTRMWFDALIHTECMGFENIIETSLNKDWDTLAVKLNVYLPRRYCKTVVHSLETPYSCIFLSTPEM